MRNYLLVWVCILVSLYSGHSQGKHSFVLGKNDFLLDGNPFQIISGELHPSRIPFEYWGHRNWTVDLPGTESREPILEILVEGMGHINFAQYMIDRKGITDRVTLNGMTLMAWETYLMPFDEKMIAGLKLGRTRSEDKNGTFFKVEFELDETGDTYFDMSGYVKGYLYINGHHLGRYWNRGPQQRLYCPASWLKKGKNEIIVFDLHEYEARKIGSEKKLY